MLKLYYARPSLYARPVWLALLEKQLAFELIAVDLRKGEQLEPEFLALNPFGHIPVLSDGGFRLIESLAILDYLEAQYPTPSLLPTDAQALARVRMTQLVSLNELLPAIVGLVMQNPDTAEFQYATLRTHNTLTFLDTLLGDHPYFAGEQLTLAEIVAGTLVPLLPQLGISLAPFQQLQQWSERLLAREAWQRIQLSPEEWLKFKRHLRVLPKVWQGRRQQRVAVLTQKYAAAGT